MSLKYHVFDSIWLYSWFWSEGRMHNWSIKDQFCGSTNVFRSNSVTLWSLMGVLRELRIGSNVPAAPPTSPFSVRTINATNFEWPMNGNGAFSGKTKDDGKHHMKYKKMWQKQLELRSDWGEIKYLIILLIILKDLASYLCSKARESPAKSLNSKEQTYHM